MMKQIMRFFLIVFAGFLISVFFLKTGKSEKAEDIRYTDLVNHPTYSSYKFNNTENVINIGSQPLYFPTSIITETMKRDNILLKNLSHLGMTINFYPFLKGEDINYFLYRDELDGGVCGDMPTIIASATTDIIVSSLMQRGFTSIVAKRTMFIKELKGKKIGYAFGSNAHYALLNTLLSAGITTKQVRLISMEVNEMTEALHSGKIDAFSAWEPTPTITLAKYPKSKIIHRYLNYGYMFFHKRFFYKHPEAVKQIISAEIRAIRWIQSDIQNLFQAVDWAIYTCEKLTKSKFNISSEEAADVVQNDILALNSPPIIPKNSLKSTGTIYKDVEFLKNIGKLPDSVNFDKVLNSFDRKIMLDLLGKQKKYMLNEFNYNLEKYNNE